MYGLSKRTLTSPFFCLDFIAIESHSQREPAPPRLGRPKPVDELDFFTTNSLHKDTWQP